MIQSRYERKVLLYNRCFRCVNVDESVIFEGIETLARVIVSFALLLLMFNGKLPGVYGGLYVTVILGIDFAAVFQAYKNTQTQTTFRE